GRPFALASLRLGVLAILSRLRTFEAGFAEEQAALANCGPVSYTLRPHESAGFSASDPHARRAHPAGRSERGRSPSDRAPAERNTRPCAGTNDSGRRA